jgi:hypothetical protein
MQSSFFSRFRLCNTLAKGVSLVVLLALLGGAATVALTACNKTEQHEAAEETAADVPENAGQGGTKVGCCNTIPTSVNGFPAFSNYFSQRFFCCEAVPLCVGGDIPKCLATADSAKIFTVVTNQCNSYSWSSTSTPPLDNRYTSIRDSLLSKINTYVGSGAVYTRVVSMVLQVNTPCTPFNLTDEKIVFKVNIYRCPAPGCFCSGC